LPNQGCALSAWNYYKEAKRMSEGTNAEQRTDRYETVHIEKTDNICPLCEERAKREASKPIVVMSCEGACLRGEVARLAANRMCFELASDKTARVCLGAAFTKDTGQRNLVRNAKKLLALEGCFIQCASRMMKGVLPDLQPEVVLVDGLYDFDTNLFGIDEMSEEEMRTHARTVAEKLVKDL
jgi:uncharacterized metal-binding protein